MMNGSYLAWADAPQTTRSASAYYSDENPATLTGAGEATRIPVSRVTPSTIELLGVRPVRGRIFDATEGRSRQQPPLALISYGLWEQRFGLRDDIVGQPLVLDGTPAHDRRRDAARVQISERRGARVARVAGRRRSTIPAAPRPARSCARLARLKPGVTPAQAAAEGTARAIAAPDAGPVAMALFGARDPIQITVTDAMEAAAADVRPAIIILLIASVLLFATAIANVANMQLARATVRHRELTIRAALGAGTAGWRGSC